MDKKNTILTFEKSQPRTQLDASIAAYKKLLERQEQRNPIKNILTQAQNEMMQNNIKK